MNYVPSPIPFVRDQVARYEESAGARGGLMDNGAPVVILTTVGRRTGALRKTPLIRVKHESAYIVVASMGGAPHHPAWYLNLRANPEVHLQDGAAIHALRAQPVSGTERTRLWPVAVAVWPDFDVYQSASDREIPLVLLEPL